MTQSPFGHTNQIPGIHDLLRSPFPERKFDRELQVCETARRVLSFCRYRRAADHYCFVRPSSRHGAFGARRRDASLIVLDLGSPIRWLEDVYSKGLAGASNCFVFEVAGCMDGGQLIVLAARQGKGCALRLGYALARFSRGDWSLDWKDLPQVHRLLPLKLSPVTDKDYYRLALCQRMARSLEEVIGPAIKTEGS